MEVRKLEITLISAENLPDVRILGLMKVYAEVSLNGEEATAKKTCVDVEGETNPVWNSSFDYVIKESSVREGGVDLVVKLCCQRTMGDKLVGEVKIPINRLFERGIRVGEDEIDDDGGVVSYGVEGTRNGRLKISYAFGDVFLVAWPSVWRKAMWNAAETLLRGIMWLLATGLIFIFYLRRRRADEKRKVIL